MSILLAVVLDQVVHIVQAARRVRAAPAARPPATQQRTAKTASNAKT